MAKRFRILLINDDSYSSPSIIALAKKLSEHADVITVAPLSNKSGTSSSFTLMETLIVRNKENLRIVQGSPVDCAHLAITVKDFLPWSPDLTVSGINLGVNLGNDSVYSGTIGAAIESVSLGVPAIAFSMRLRQGTPMQEQCEDAATACSKLTFALADKLINSPTVALNINIPGVPLEEHKKPVACPLGISWPRRNVVREQVQPTTDIHFKIGDIKAEGKLPDHCDAKYLAKGHITVTPIKYVLTAEDKIAMVNKWIK